MPLNAPLHRLAHLIDTAVPINRNTEIVGSERTMRPEQQDKGAQVSCGNSKCIMHRRRGVRLLILLLCQLRENIEIFERGRISANF